MATPERRSRVHLTMTVNDQGAQREVELPFVIGVMGDFSMDSKAPAQRLEARKFVEINRDNFDAVMNELRPGISDLKVDNLLDPQSEELLAVDHLEFRSLSDFEPAKVALQVPELAKLLQTRDKLKELAAHADFSPEIESLLEVLLKQGGSGEAGKTGQES